jgi:hypothetical protein
MNEGKTVFSKLIGSVFPTVSSAAALPAMAATGSHALSVTRLPKVDATDDDSQ